MALSIFLPHGLAEATKPTEPQERQTIQQRVNAIRKELRESGWRGEGQSVDEARGPRGDEKVSQWYNWPNWPNWGNGWSNYWRNW